MTKIGLLCILSLVVCITGQRITTIHLDGVQYFVSRMNPYSPELNYFLAYQYCRSLGLQLASFETKEKAESMTMYLKNAGYGNYDFWTSGNRLGTGMFLWMSTGLPFNATFDFFENSVDAVQAGLLDPVDHNSNTSPQRTARDSSSGAEKGCVILKQPTLKWMPEDCSAVKDFICEQTRCYYYNYGSIPVSSAQGRPITSTTSRTVSVKIHTSTTPLPIIMNTYTTSPKMVQQAPRTSFDSLKLDHERDLETNESENEDRHDSIDVEDDDQIGILDLDSNSYDEHARELNYVKDQNPSNTANDLHHEVQSREDLQQRPQNFATERENENLTDVKTHVYDGGEVPSISIEHHSASVVRENRINVDGKSAVSSTSTEVPEVQIKQISKEIEKITNKIKHHGVLNNNPAVMKNDNDDIGRTSFLSLTDLIRTLRPNDKQIIPQIDSDYSNAMRVLGENSAVVTDDESRKFKDVNRAIF